MSKKIYIDGCSHMTGHDFSIGKERYMQALFQNVYMDSVAGATITAAATAKCNEAMFFDFLSCFDILKEGDSVVIYWSHAERFTQRALPIDRCEKNEQGKFLNNIAAFKNLNPGPYDTPVYTGTMYSNTKIENLSWSFLYRTYMHMYAVQEMCKSKNINYYFLTVDPYYKFQTIPKEYREQAPVDESKVFNWPLPEVFKWGNFDRTNYNHFLIEWTLTSLPILVGRALSKENKGQYIHKDYKHLTLAGHAILYEWIVDWINDPSRDLSWIINNKLTHEAAREFNTIEFHLKEFNLDGFEAVHWVEQVIEELLEQLTPAITYVYE